MSFTVREIRTQKERRPLPWKRTLLRVVHFGRPLIEWYRKRREARAEHQRELHHRTLLKRVLFVLVSVLCALVLVAGTVRALVAVRILSLDTFLNAAGTDLPRDTNGFINVLLLGQGDDDHEGIDLTDTIIVASIDPERTKSVAMLSIPRDTYILDTVNMGEGRINSLYRDYKIHLQRQGKTVEEASTESLMELKNEIGRVLGISIQHVAKVNFTAFEQTVDALGGIDVNVEEEILDTNYPNQSYGYETFHLPAGPQHLDGATALKYARSRHSTSDFSRSARQQQVILAMAQKAKDEGYAHDAGFITSMVKNLSQNVETSLSIREMISLADVARSLDRSRVITMQLSDRNGLYGTFSEPGGFLYTPPRDLFGGAAVLLPVSIPEYPVTWKQPQMLTALLFGARDVYLAHPTIHVLNNGAKSGLARILASELIRYGFSVDLVENADLPAKQDTSVIAGRPALPATDPTSLSATPGSGTEALAKFFGALLNIPYGPLPGDLPQEQRADITIVLGTAYQYSPLQDAVPQPPPSTP